MRGLTRLLIAGAGATACLSDGAAWLVARDVCCVGLHGVGVVRVNGFVS